MDDAEFEHQEDLHYRLENDSRVQKFMKEYDKLHPGSTDEEYQEDLDIFLMNIQKPQ